MRIGGVGARPAPASDIASALAGAAAQLGQRPAITDLGTEGRHEQGFVSLAGWVSKGANLLRDEFDLARGDRLGVASPPGWPLAAVVLSAWWLGVTIVPAATPGLRLRVLHTALPGLPHLTTTSGPDAGATGDVLWIGDAADGTGHLPGSGGESWTDAVIPHPDRPPAPDRDGTSVAIDLVDPVVDLAVDDAARTSGVTQGRLLGDLAEDPGGVVGLLRHGDQDLIGGPQAVARLTALVLRPLVTGAATVVAAADDPGRGSITAAERVIRWLA